MLWLLEALIVPSLVAGPSAAQFASGVNLVEVYATVTDARGEPVPNLTAGEFEVAEDGLPQTIATFAAGDVPLSVVIALDRSFSMAGDRLALAKRAAASFVDALRDDDEVTVVAIGSEIETIAPPVRAREARATRWDAIDTWGTTPLFDATRQAIDLVQARRGRRALLIVSDGVDRGSETTATALIDHARRTDVLVYPVAIAKTRPPVFAELASVTGGRSIFVSDPKELEGLLRSLARELRMQYLLGYTPSRPSEGEAAWHAIDVRVKRPDVKVRARDGYFGR
jgi:Ca-activated chloride channel family protein